MTQASHRALIGLSSVPSEHIKLVEAALNAKHNAYAPYSHFKVGCAVQTEDGQVFIGVNVENASFGLTICAERSAVFAAVSSGHRTLTAVAVLAEKAGAPPCGACRQVLSEFMSPQAPVYFLGKDGGVTKMSIADLLPAPFEPSSLKKF